MGHLAISDVSAGRHHSAERFSRAAAGLAGAQTQPLRIWLGSWSIEGAAGQLFPLQLRAGTPDLGVALTLGAGTRPVVLQGDRGLSQKSAAPGNASYYYSLTRLPTQGEIRIGDRRWQVEGNSWFDREWSSSALAADQAGWDWFALQLEDGRDLMFYQMRDKQGRAQTFSHGVLVDADGSTRPLPLDAVQLTRTASWRSPDGTRYPVAWRLQVPEQDLDLAIEAAFEDQVMQHTVEYWEGAVNVSGSHRGVGYLELSGYAR
jgi:predicted secreted hydrolase